MARERIEDLGRICVLIDNVIHKHNEFKETYSGRNKDFCQWFDEQDQDKKDEVLHKLIYDRDDLTDELYQIYEIAEGVDRLNFPELL